MQPRPIETSSPLLPSFRICTIAPRDGVAGNELLVHFSGRRTRRRRAVRRRGPCLRRCCTAKGLPRRPLQGAPSADRLVLQKFLHGRRVDAGAHRSIDAAGADGVDANALRRDVESCALGEADDAVFGRVVRGPSGQANEAPSEEQFTIAPPPYFFI
jgi:hypothetical protein